MSLQDPGLNLDSLKCSKKQVCNHVIPENHLSLRRSQSLKLIGDQIANHLVLLMNNKDCHNWLKSIIYISSFFGKSSNCGDSSGTKGLTWKSRQSSQFFP